MIDFLLSRFAKGRHPPVSPQQLAEAQQRLGLRFPDRLAEFYRQSDGLVVDERRLTLIDLANATKYAKAIDDGDFCHRLGLFPISESNDSNPYCVSCKPPLFGRLIHLRHDDASRLAFRDVDAFAQAILALSANDEWHIDDLPLGYNRDHSDRTSEDDAAADALLAGDCPDVENTYAIAISLFSRNRASSIIKLLEYDNMWVREDAARHLEHIGDIAAIDALAVLADGDRQDNRAAQRALKVLNRIKHRG